MKRIAFVITMISALALLTVPVSAGSPGSYDSVVVGKGDPAYDVKAVQDAVDKGGKVLLKGTFDFGEKGRVNIKNDVEIFGEVNERGDPVTKIKGGFWSFHSPLPSQLPPQAPGPKITIQGIHFDGALYGPIHLAYSSGAAIKANKITNVRPDLPSVPVFGKQGIYRQQGIVFCPLYALPKEKRRYQPGAITGCIMVTDNDIDLTCEEPEKTLAQGVVLIQTTGANIQILRNRVVNCSKNSIETLDNFRGDDGSGMIIIKDNNIVTAIKGVPVPTPSAPNGIIAGWFLDLAGGADPKRNSKLIIMGNHIEARGDTSMGICMLCDSPVVMSNNIVLGGGKKARGLVQMGSDGLIANNKVEGSGMCAWFAMPYKALSGCRNTFAGNDLSHFKPLVANVMLMSNYNVLKGESGKVIDKGQGNQTLD